MEPEEYRFLIHTMQMNLAETHSILTRETRRINKALGILDRLAEQGKRVMSQQKQVKSRQSRVDSLLTPDS